MDDESRRRRRARKGASRSRRRVEFADDDWDDEDLDTEPGDEDEDDEDEDDYEEEEPAPRQRKRRRSRGRTSGSKHGRKLDWSAAGDLDEEEDYDDEERDEPPRRRERKRTRRRRAPQRVGLMQLCTPVFGFAAMLPREGSASVQPDYQQFRTGVLQAMNEIQNGAAQHGIDTTDAADAVYALALFMDEQVAESVWTHRDTWSSQPLNAPDSLINDPMGGVNFFQRLDALHKRQRELKKILLVCLALGFRGELRELDEVHQASRLGEIRRKLIRSIHKKKDKDDALFPEGYRAADPLADTTPPAPRWWMMLSLGTVILAALLFALLFWRAAHIPEPAAETLKRYRAAEYTPPPPAEPDDSEATGGVSP